MSALLKVPVWASHARRVVGRISRSGRQAKRVRAEFYQRLWRRTASELGASVIASVGDLLCISRGDATAKVFQNYTDLDGPATLRAAGNKPLVHELLAGHGVPVPEFLSVSATDLTAASTFLQWHDSCVVKPAYGSGAGAGVTTSVRTRGQLTKAAVLAASYCSQLVVEQQIPGKNVRLLYLDGQLLDAVERRPPSVVGDGRSTLGHLVRQMNRHRLEQGSRLAQSFLRYDLDMQRTLAGQGIAWGDVPEAGQRVQLKTVINDNAAADNVSVTELVGDDLVATGRRAAQTLGVRLAGVDVIAPDLTVPLSESGGVVLEINTAPGLYIHQGKPGVSVAVPILEACLDRVHPLRDSLSTADPLPTSESRNRVSSC